MVAVETSQSDLKHLAIIPDGNGRWAQKHYLEVWQGHLAGTQRALELADLAIDRMDRLGIEVFSFWGFSTENWSRSEGEIGKLMSMTQQLIEQHGHLFVDRGVRFRHIGRKDRLPADLLQVIEGLEQRTAVNSRKTFVLPLDYGGRDEIIRAVNSIDKPVDEVTFKDYLDTAGLPDPDLIIRTAGEMRISGLFPYQGAYAEFISSPVLFPDFDERELDRCLDEYFNRRKRRFGGRPESTIPKPFDWLDLQNADFENYLQALRPHLDLATKTFVEDWRRSKKNDFGPLQKDIDLFQRMLSGGKKIRAALVLLGFENFAGESNFREGALQAAVGFETIHNSFLIHDDIEDNSEIRRGQPSAHRYYQQQTSSAPENYGLSLALNAGSLGPLRAQDVLWSIYSREDRIIAAQKLVRDIVEVTLQGQRRDLTLTTMDELSEQDVYKIYCQKTAYYTIAGPLMLGAILAGASRADIRYIPAFGVSLGMAFQIVDDHLGIYGSEEVLGKPVGSDITEAKKTLHFVRAWQRANQTQRELLLRVWGNRDIGFGDVEDIKSLFTDLGVRDDVLKVAERLSSKAKSFIPKVSTNPVVVTILNDLADYVVRRDY